MICIVGTRRSGKTSRLIEMSAESRTPILARDKRSAEQIAYLAKKMGIEIPQPIVGCGVYPVTGYVSVAAKRTVDGLSPVLVDDLDRYFAEMGLRADVVTIDRRSVGFIDAIEDKPTLRNCLRTWWRCRRDVRSSE